MSQTTRFNNTYDWNNSEASSNIFTNGNGYVVIGPAKDSTTGYSGIGFLFIDSIGIQIGKKTFGKISSSYLAPSAIRTVDNSFAVTCQFVDNSANYDACLIKFNQNGDTIWTKVYSDTLVQAGVSCKQTIDGYIICGRTENYVAGNTNGRYLLLKTDSNGNMQWKKAIGNSSYADEGNFISIVNDGGFIFGGSSAGSVFIPSIFKTDSNGNVQWTRMINTNWDGIINCVQQTLDGGYLASGCIADSGGGAVNYNKAFVVKLFPNGSIDWINKNYSENPKSLDTFTNFIELSDNSSVVVGTMMNDTAVHYLDMDGVIYHISPSGSIIWKRRYDKTGGFNKADGFNYLTTTNDGGYIVCGSFAQPQYDFWVVKVDSLGCDSAGCEFVGIEEKPAFENPQSEIFVYPNPARDEIFVQINNQKEDGKVIEFKMYDITGRIVFENHSFLKLHSEKFNVSEFNSGLYFYSISDDNNFISRGKLIITH